MIAWLPAEELVTAIREERVRRAAAWGRAVEAQPAHRQRAEKDSEIWQMLERRVRWQYSIPPIPEVDYAWFDRADAIARSTRTTFEKAREAVAEKRPMSEDKYRALWAIDEFARDAAFCAALTRETNQRARKAGRVE